MPDDNTVEVDRVQWDIQTGNAAKGVSDITVVARVHKSADTFIELSASTECQDGPTAHHADLMRSQIVRRLKAAGDIPESAAPTED
jgi:hypothetical protein